MEAVVSGYPRDDPRDSKKVSVSGAARLGE